MMARASATLIRPRLAGRAASDTLFPIGSNASLVKTEGFLLSMNRRIVLAFPALLMPGMAGAQDSAGGGVTVFAAASLTDSLKQVADAYQARTGAAVTLSFGASSTL